MASGPFLRDVALGEVLRHDLPSYIVGLLFLFAVSFLLFLPIAVRWLGAPPPKESPGEIFLGFVIVAGAVLAFLRYRAHRVTEALRNGEVVEAEVLRGFAYQFFAQVLVGYTVQGRAARKHLWLPNTKRPRALCKARRVSLAVPAGGTGGVIVRDLYG